MVTPHETERRDRDILRRVRELVVARPRDLPDVPRERFSVLARRGDLERIARGAYVVADAEVSEHRDLVIVARMVPHATVCLLSALSFHELTTQFPRGVWIAIENKAHAPALSYPPLHIVRMTGASLSEGVESHVVDGVSVPIFNPAKTVADCFKFRNRIGLDVALEALREYHQNQRGRLDALWECAETCRVRDILRPYLEALQ